MKDETPLVSVLVPVCNVEAYLRACICHLLAQTLEDIEIICIDDGSTDSSLAILTEYAQNDSRMKIISKPNSGYGDSMNKGLELARGKYVAIVESDDFIDEDALERLVALAEEHDVEVVKTNFYTHLTDQDYHEDPVLPNLQHCECGIVLDPHEKQEIFLTQPAIWSALYRRDFLADNEIAFLPTPGASFQDTSFNFKVFACAKRVYLSEEAFLHYRIDNANSSVKSLSKVFCICDEYAEMWRFLDERNLLAVLGKRLAQVQYGGYYWNLYRLTPNLQYQFYQRFLQDFQGIQKRGFLSEDHFDPAVWGDLSRMLEDGDKFFRDTLGPIEVATTFAVQVPSAAPKLLLKTLTRLAVGLSENDELICIVASYDEAIAQAINEAHVADARIFDGNDFCANGPFQVVSLEDVRGKELVAVSLDDLKVKTIAHLLLWIESGYAALTEPAIAASRYLVSELETDERPLLFPLLTWGFYGLREFTEGKLAGYPARIQKDLQPEVSQSKVALKDFVAAKEAFDGLADWAFGSFESYENPGNELRQVFSRVLVPLWAELLCSYDAMSFNDRVGFGEKPSSLDYPALVIAGDSTVAEDATVGTSSDVPDVTVIIPVYNAQDYLPTCLESVLCQEGVSLQVICIDDGSSDASLEIMEELAGVDGRLGVYAQLNGGAGAARNRGIDLARGRYLAFIDPDDYYPSSHALAHLYEAAVRNKAKLCGGSFISFLPSGKMKMTYYGNESSYTIREEGFRSFEEDEFDYGWIRFIYDRALFAQDGPRFPEYRWYEDPVFFTEVIDLVGEYYVIPEPTYCYREDYKKPSWTPVKVRDMLAGIAHNLEFAQGRNFDRLYTRLVDRIDHDYGDAILSQLDDEEVLLRMTEIQASLQIDRVAYLREQGCSAYLLNPLYYRICKERKTAVRRLADRIESSNLYEKMQSYYEQYRKR